MTGVYDIRAHHDISPPSTRAGLVVAKPPACISRHPPCAHGQPMAATVCG